MANDETIIDIVKNIDPSCETVTHRNQLTIIISAEKLIEICREIKNNPETSFDQLTDITAIDWLRKNERFEVVYFFYSIKFKHRLRMKVRLEGDYPTCPSLTPVYENANWYERETYDMYGIKFEGHPNLRRFYMPEDFTDPESGEPLYPLRKDFPLMGVPDSLPLPPYPEKLGDVI